MEHSWLGQYIPGDSGLHRADPRVKIISTLVITIVLVGAGNWRQLLLLLTLLLGLGLWSRIKVREYWQGIKPFLFLILISALIQIFLTEGNSIISWGIIKISEAGLLKALELSWRLLLIVYAAQILLFTTTIVAMTDGLALLLRPLELIRFPVNELVMIMTISLHFIPLLLSEGQRIRWAQISRGLDFGQGSILERARTYFAILVPLINASFQKAHELAEVMEARGYMVGSKRNRLYPLILRSGDYYILLFLLIMVAGIMLAGS